MTTRFNVRKFGAVGNGFTDDTAAIQSAFNAAIIEGISAVYVPPGQYLITREIAFPTITGRLAIFGDGANVSVIYAQGCAGLNLNFAQNGAQQPYGVTIRNLGIRALGVCGTGIRISYGVPPVTNDHNQPSCTLSNVQVTSGPEGHWANGIEIEGAWNPTLENVFISGDSAGGVWNNMHGSGVVLRGMSVNAHLSNVRCNFWETGLRVHSSDGRNTEGIFCSNCSMVAVKRGVHIKGDPTVTSAPRVSTLTWVGGLIECRVKDVEGISAAIFLENVWTALISSAQFIAEFVPELDIIVSGVEMQSKFSYAVLVADSAGVVVSACDLSGWSYGVHSAGACRALAVTGCTFTNVEKQVVFPAGTVDSRSYGAVLFNNSPFEWSASDTNKLGFVA